MFSYILFVVFWVLNAEEDEAHRQMLARLATIFPVALMCHLRVNQPLEQELKERVSVVMHAFTLSILPEIQFRERIREENTIIF